jgi:hypothetical protein
MTDDRYQDLMETDGTLSAEEMAEGWHWCHEFDGMLVGPGQWGLEECTCLEVEGCESSRSPSGVSSGFTTSEAPISDSGTP